MKGADKFAKVDVSATEPRAQAGVGLSGRVAEGCPIDAFGIARRALWSADRGIEFFARNVGIRRLRFVGSGLRLA